jgi:hypothetical protein
MITISHKMNDVIFDGKWSFFSEWKGSSLNELDNSLKIRSAHYEDFVYIFVDSIYDTSLDIGSDRAVICFDSQNNKSEIPDINDHCFIAILDRENGFTYRGNSPFGIKSNFEKISNHDDFIAIGSISDSNDRYSKIPHPSYEFKIPTEVIGRSSNYGFYVETFDAKTGNSLIWPPGIDKKSPMSIPSPKFWGEMISPDKSLPEFPLPIFIMTILIFSMIIMSRKLNYNRLRINTL